MLCSVCRRQVLRSDPRCRACGTPLDAERHLDLVLPGGERVPIDRRLVIGRSGACELRLDDPSVSRIHAAIEPDDAGRPLLSDLGSSYGTHLEGRKVQEPALLEPGMTVTLGDTRFTVEERVDATAAGMTVSVPAGVSLLLKVPPELARERSPRHAARRAARADPMPGHEARRPRMRSGWSLKRGDASEGERRHLLKNQRSGAVLALAGPEAELVELLDGRHDLPTLIAASEERCGPDGISRLARLLAELADHDMLAGVEASEQTPGRLERLARPRELDWRWLPRGIASVYRRGGWLLFTRPAQALLALVALVGLVAFVSLIVGGGGTPLVVARRVGVGAAVFVAGRFALALCHEFAHGLCAESFGRPVTRAGVKIVLTFPYLFVDTTDAWFESRPRRIAIALAGPASDLTLGGAFAIACWICDAGALRDVFFQLAFGGYVGALFNLNPLLERDGYHVLVDTLREPGLRRRASRRLADALAGLPADTATARPRRLLGYGVASLVWSVVMVLFTVAITLRYYHRLAGLIPASVVWVVLVGFYCVVALPLAVTLLAPLWARVSRPHPA